MVSIYSLTQSAPCVSYDLKFAQKLRTSRLPNLSPSTAQISISRHSKLKRTIGVSSEDWRCCGLQFCQLPRCTSHGRRRYCQNTWREKAKICTSLLEGVKRTSRSDILSPPYLLYEFSITSAGIFVDIGEKRVRTESRDGLSATSHGRCIRNAFLPFRRDWILQIL